MLITIFLTNNLKKLQAPNFWHKRSIISYLLTPLSYLYLLGYFIYWHLKKSQKVKKPVICIGNLVAGGAGKTPIALQIGQILKQQNIDFAYLSGGYGGNIKDFTKVNYQTHSSLQVGDEPLLLCQIADTFIADARLFAAKKIANMDEKQLIITDDGFQDPALKKDLSILVIDGNYGFGNGFIFPAGPLRQRVKDAVNKADLAIIVGDDKFKIANRFFDNKQVVNAQIKAINADDFKDKKVIAFCGIGRPQKFFDSLKQSNIDIIAQFPYPDHHQFCDSEIKKIIDLANKNKATAITTKKDWVRLNKNWQKQIKYLDITIDFADEDLIKEKILKLINANN